MNEIINVAKNIHEQIEDMTEFLYQEKITEGCASLNPILVQMEQLIQEILVYQNGTGQRIMDETKLLGSVQEALQALEAKDYVLLADIFRYDIKEQLEQIAG